MGRGPIFRNPKYAWQDVMKKVSKGAHDARIQRNLRNTFDFFAIGNITDLCLRWLAQLTVYLTKKWRPPWKFFRLCDLLFGQPLTFELPIFFITFSVHWTVSSLFLNSDDNRGEPEKWKTHRLRRYEPDCFPTMRRTLSFSGVTVFVVSIIIAHLWRLCRICHIKNIFLFRAHKFYI